MSTHPAQDMEGPRLPVASLPTHPGAVILALSQAVSHAELFESSRGAVGVTRRLRQERDQYAVLAGQSLGARSAAQLEHYDHHARCLRVAPVALLFVALDVWVLYLGAEAFADVHLGIALGAALCLVTLGLLETGLAWSSKRNKHVCRAIAAGLLVCTSLLALVRFGFLAAVGAGRVAIVGASVVIVCAMALLIGRFAVTRYAGTLTIGRARRRTARPGDTRSDFKRNQADIAAPAQLAPFGRSRERPGSILRGQAKEMCHGRRAA